MVFRRKKNEQQREVASSTESALGKIQVVEGGSFVGVTNSVPIALFVVSNKFIRFGKTAGSLFAVQDYRWEGPKYTTKEVTTSQRVGGSNTLKRAAVGKMVGGRRGALIGAATSRPGKTVKQTHQKQVEEPALATAVLINTETKESGTIRFLCTSRENQGWQRIEKESGASSDASDETKEELSIDSAADEILKFKTLLDQGIITQEEFDHQKKRLLGMK